MTADHLWLAVYAVAGLWLLANLLFGLAMLRRRRRTNPPAN
jgi:hypothetical protein